MIARADALRLPFADRRYVAADIRQIECGLTRRRLRTVARSLPLSADGERAVSP